jgi:hypothetical protein
LGATVKKMKAWEGSWRTPWVSAYRRGAGLLSNAAAIANKRVRAANDSKYIGA